MPSLKKREQLVFDKGGLPVKVGFYQGKSSSGYPPLFHHKEIEIQLFVSGEGRYFIRGKTYHIRKNTVLIIHGNEIHRYLPHPDSFIKRYNLIFGKPSMDARPVSAKILRELVGIHAMSLPEMEATECQYLMEEIARECKTQKEYWKELAADGIKKILVLLKRSLSANKVVQPSDNSVVGRVIPYLENNYFNRLSLEEVSAKFFLSPYYLSRIFKKHTGFGFKEYLIHLRISEAKNMLLSKEMKVSAIAHNVGFHELSSFNLNFRRLTGYTPSAYRKIFTGKENQAGNILHDKKTL